MLDFTVKSSVHNYEVKFIEDAINVLKNEIRDGDVIIIDNKVKLLNPYLLKNLNCKISVIGIDAHEENKSYKGLIPIIQELIRSGFRKNHRLIGIGGGIIQDITAFSASIMYRGVDWLFFPTTLLAQGDSCIGSKTSINFGEYKNQVGGFYPPSKILINNLCPIENRHDRINSMKSYYFFMVSNFSLNSRSSRTLLVSISPESHFNLKSASASLPPCF